MQEIQSLKFVIVINGQVGVINMPIPGQLHAYQTDIRIRIISLKSGNQRIKQPVTAIYGGSTWPLTNNFKQLFGLGRYAGKIRSK